MLIRVSLSDNRDRNAVGTENQLGLFRVRKAGQSFFNLLDQRFQINIVPIESINGMNRNPPVKMFPPLVQAAARRSRGILRIKRKQHDLVTIRRAKLFNCLSGKRMPITHGDKAMGANPERPQGRLQRPRLQFRKASNR